MSVSVKTKTRIKQQGCFGRLFGMACLPFALYLLAFAAGLEGDRARIAGAPVLEAVSAKGRSGLALLTGKARGAFKTVRGAKAPLLYGKYRKQKKSMAVHDVKVVRNGRTEHERKRVVSWDTVDSEEKYVDRFALGPVVVKTRPIAPRWLTVSLLSRRFDERPRINPRRGSPGLASYSETFRERTDGVRADRVITVYGVIEGGVIEAREGQPFVVGSMGPEPLRARMSEDEGKRILLGRIVTGLLLWVGVAWLYGHIAPAREGGGWPIFYALFAAVVTSLAAIPAFRMGEIAGLGICVAILLSLALLRKLRR